ncbi:MAG: hypothetical protein US49_C0006G0046 [candidate division TM6 bacterium GW2011_GWF2_37_49]|nr:MAG: hypothetical protein US49_C0006G0046 [candidate division TM6 bacterium GW2011_GWF2_37_49]
MLKRIFLQILFVSTVFMGHAMESSPGHKQADTKFTADYNPQQNTIVACAYTNFMLHTRIVTLIKNLNDGGFEVNSVRHNYNYLAIDIDEDIAPSIIEILHQKISEFEQSMKHPK